MWCRHPFWKTGKMRAHCGTAVCLDGDPRLILALRGIGMDRFVDVILERYRILDRIWRVEYNHKYIIVNI